MWKAVPPYLSPAGYRSDVEHPHIKTVTGRLQNWCGTHSHQICVRPGTELVGKHSKQMCLRPGTQLVWKAVPPKLSPTGYRIGVEGSCTKTVSDRVQIWCGMQSYQVCLQPGTELVWKTLTHNVSPTGYRIDVERCSTKTVSCRVKNW